MGQSISDFFTSLFKSKDARILIVGLDNAGKSTILYKLKLDEYVTTIPTIGFRVETINYKDTTFTMWDLGGQSKIRPLWKHYIQNTNAVIFVLDSSDRNRMNEAREELHRLMVDEHLKECKVLILANKQDINSALSTSEIEKRLDVSNIKQPTFVQSCSAKKGEGLIDGLEWLTKVLEKN